MTRPQLVGIAEIAQLFGVTRQAASNWRVRHENFPPPAALRSEVGLCAELPGHKREGRGARHGD